MHLELYPTKYRREMKYLPEIAVKESFFEAVYDVVQLIPPGRVTTYGAIAHYLGTKRSARMVGWALNRAAHHLEIPAHRVVNRHGLLTGQRHFGNNKEMEQRLAAEGVRVVDNSVQKFEHIFWDPGQNCQL